MPQCLYLLFLIYILQFQNVVKGFQLVWVLSTCTEVWLSTLLLLECLLCKKSTIHQVTTMLATSKNVLLPGHNDLLTTSADDLSLLLSPLLLLGQ